MVGFSVVRVVGGGGEGREELGSEGEMVVIGVIISIEAFEVGVRRGGGGENSEMVEEKREDRKKG